MVYRHPSFGSAVLVCCMNWHSGAALRWSCLVQCEQQRWRNGALAGWWYGISVWKGLLTDWFLHPKLHSRSNPHHFVPCFTFSIVPTIQLANVIPFFQGCTLSKWDTRLGERALWARPLPVLFTVSCSVTAGYSVLGKRMNKYGVMWNIISALHGGHVYIMWFCPMPFHFDNSTAFSQEWARSSPANRRGGEREANIQHSWCCFVFTFSSTKQ